MEEVHKIFYEEDDNRQYWECQTCSSAGSGPLWSLKRYDPEEHAERSHRQHGITHLVTVNKRTYP